MYFDEFGLRPIFKQEKRKWVAVSNSHPPHRSPTPTVKPFFSRLYAQVVGGLLSGVF